MGPSTLSTQVDYSRNLQVHYGGNRTLGLKSMAQVHKLTPVAPSSPLRWQPYLRSEIHGPGTQVDSGRTFKLALAATVPWV
jgi:hypothetical protein